MSIDKTTGKVTIADGSQANESILTSDANGVATWQPKTVIRVPEVVFIGEQSGTYTLTDYQSIFNAVKDRIPLNVRTGSLAGWDPVNKQYTIQATGYYRVFCGAKLVGTTNTPTNVAVYLGPWSALTGFDGLTTYTGPVVSTMWEGSLNAGDKVTLYGAVFGNQNSAIASRGFLSITKLF